MNETKQETKHTPGPWHVEESTHDVSGKPYFHYIVSHKEDEEWHAVGSTWSTPNIFDATLMSLAPEMASSLAELYALVKGECPALLDEDSGGIARLDIAISALLTKLDGAK